MRDDGLFPKVENLEIDLELISFIIKSEEGFILKEIPKMEMNANSIRRKLFAFEREGIIEEIDKHPIRYKLVSKFKEPMKEWIQVTKKMLNLKDEHKARNAVKRIDKREKLLC